MGEDLSYKRKEYEQFFIDFSNLPASPFILFKEWYNNAEQSNLIDEPNAFTLSTITESSRPKSRVVLLKEYSPEGFIFYTNYKSEKGLNIAYNPNVCLSFFWKEAERQVIINGVAHKISSEKSDAYFAKRPLASQLAANLSQQSQPVSPDFDEIKALNELKKSLKEIKRPPNWGGYLVRPDRYEFWQGRPNRLHHRVQYKLITENTWEQNRLWG